MDRNSKDQLDRAAALAIFKSGKPYTIFEDSGMVEFIQMLNPAYKPPSGDRIASILPEVYQDYRVQVKEILDDADHLNVIFDASDDISSNRIVNISISIPNSVTFYWKTVNTRNEEHTALNTIRLIQPLLEERVGILWVYGSQVGYIGKESSRILGELCSFRAFLQCYKLPSFWVLKRLKTVKDNPAEPMVVKNWETVDVARLVKIENAFQDSIVVDGWGWEETDLENSGDDMDIRQ
ncbi:hypothetical protein S40293_10252 [Stachybotrys chartarum IBT 40293]|nr:hypothetical protein S40293_10252 [Stachybotrys chartarum IBT 40293]